MSKSKKFEFFITAIYLLAILYLLVDAILYSIKNPSVGIFTFIVMLITFIMCSVENFLKDLEIKRLKEIIQNK